MFFIFAALLLYTAAILLGTLASRNADTNLVSGVVNAVSAIIPFATVAAYQFGKRSLSFTRLGLFAAVAGGIAIALFTMALNKSFSTDKVAIVSPVVFGGAIVLSSILGSILFKEKLTPVQAAGLAIMAAGLVLVTYAKATGK